MTSSSLSKASLPQPHYLWFLVLSYCMVMVFANWFDARLIRIFTLNTDAGTLIFPLTFLLSDLITEVYGYQQARLAIWCGFLFNIVFICYGQLVSHLPTPDYAVITSAKFDDVMTFNSRIVIASISSYLISEPLNAFIMAKLKIACSGNKLALRYILSTFIASGVDSCIFTTIAFAGMFSRDNLIALMLTMWGLKVVIELVGLPLSVYLTRLLKKSEKLDIYDKHTKFTLFSLKVDYDSRDNQY